MDGKAGPRVPRPLGEIREKSVRNSKPYAERGTRRSALSWLDRWSATGSRRRLFLEQVHAASGAQQMVAGQLRSSDGIDCRRAHGPRGLAEVERAKADGRWDAAAPPPSKATVPDDLHDALAQNAAAKLLFDDLDSRNRYAILFRIHDAKKAETRAARIDKYVGMLSRGETPYPRRKAR